MYKGEWAQDEITGFGSYFFADVRPSYLLVCCVLLCFTLIHVPK
jgi:hypothetical protein